MSDKPALIVFNTHPIQYFTPLYARMAREGIPFEVWYGSDETVKGSIDKEFGVHVKWDTPLLEGYSYRFLKNQSWRPGINHGFFGLINFGVIRALWRTPKATVLVAGWNNFTCWLLIIVARLFGHRVILRGESPLSQELNKSWRNRLVKRIVLQHFLFRFVNLFLYIGQQNHDFYRYFGVPEGKLRFAPYSVDNESFQTVAREWAGRKHELRKQLGLLESPYLILTSGKFIPKKRPLDILEAIARLNDSTVAMVFVGEGELRPAMEAMVREKHIANVTLTGFVNQSVISLYYAAADLFVLASGDGETWGLVVNEAMNFNVPVVVSEAIGCGVDLAPQSRFPVGDIDALVARIQEARAQTNPCRSREIIDGYSYTQIIEAVRTAIAK